jgi:hypothetical protein
LIVAHLLLSRTFANKDTFTVLPEQLCGHVFRLGLALYDPVSITLEFSETLLLVLRRRLSHRITLRPCLSPQKGLDGRPAPSKNGTAVIVDFRRSVSTGLKYTGLSEICINWPQEYFDDAFLHRPASINLGAVLATSFKGGSTCVCVLLQCVFITAVPIAKLFARGGGEWKTCATRDYEPKPVRTSLPIAH